ncbi:hypothetical protein FRB99_009053 [Tulasnella sp. 403]|nr:hypothetical protein FRB99_009053 [Tulasnella sp. 403]
MVAQGSHPICKNMVKDYKTEVLGQKRRGTAPAPCRQAQEEEEEEEEQRDQVIGKGKAAEGVYQGGNKQATGDRGGARNLLEVQSPPTDVHPPAPTTASSSSNPHPSSPNRFQVLDPDNPFAPTPDDNDSDLYEDAMLAAGLPSDYIPLLSGYEYTFESAMGAATRPEDSPKNFKDAMSCPDK